MTDRPEDATMNEHDHRPDDAPSTEVDRVVVRDGRVLEVLTTGPPGGTPVVFHHGTPFAAVAYRAAALGVSARTARLVYWSRPGLCGIDGSTRSPRGRRGR